MQYLALGIPEIVSAPYHIFQNLERYCATLKKPRRNVIPSLGYTVNTMGWIILVHPIRGALFMPRKTQWMCNTFFKVSQKYIGLHNISFEMWKGIV